MGVSDLIAKFETFKSPDQIPILPVAQGKIHKAVSAADLKEKKSEPKLKVEEPTVETEVETEEPVVEAETEEPVAEAEEPVAEAEEPVVEAEVETEEPVVEAEVETEEPVVEAEVETEEPIAETEVEAEAEEPVVEAETEEPVVEAEVEAGKPIAETEVEVETEEPVAETEEPVAETEAPISKSKKKKNKKKAKKAREETPVEFVKQETTGDIAPSGEAEELRHALEQDVEEEAALDQEHNDVENPSSTEDSAEGQSNGESNSRIGRDSPFDFGSRQLKTEDEVWDHNAWDNVEWGEEQVKDAEEMISKQYEAPVRDFDKKLYNENPAKYWDIFYRNNRENFFKDRKWLQIEFPVLYEATKPEAGPTTIFEIGCGAGNTMFPILSENENPGLRVVGADFSPKAVDLVRTSPSFNKDHAHACVWDLANPEGALPEGVEPHSVDIAVLIFVFSALSPAEWNQAMDNLAKVMKPGGKILFRDYGRYDLAQVRFKKHRLMDDNFYIRGDGTRVYFFTEQELREIFTTKFNEVQIGTDRRLLVNRKRRLKMYRIWMQAVFEVPM